MIWPFGTTPTERSREAAILLPSGVVIRPGDTVQGGGGSLTAGQVAAVDGVRPEIPRECRSATGEIAVFNHRERLRVVPHSGSRAALTWGERGPVAGR